MAVVIGANDDNLSVREIVKEPAGKDIRKHLNERFDFATRANIEAAFKTGEELGLLLIETMSIGKNTSKFVPCARQELTK